MKKLIQFRAARDAPLQELLAFHFGRLFPGEQQFAQAASQAPLVCYLAEKKVPLSFGRVKQKTIISVVVEAPSQFANNLNLPAQIIYNDLGLIVVNKPAGLSTQPTLLVTDDCLYHQLILGEILRKNFPAQLPYFGLHHRLDRDTSGLVLLTTKPSKNKMVAQWFEQRLIKKSYWALCKGDLPEKKWRCHKNIKRKIHADHKFYFAAVEVGGQQALSHFHWLKSLAADRHLIQAEPITGRTHQLRVHLRASGLQVIGDRVYGAEATNRPMRLHAWKMVVPWQNEKMEFRCLPNWPESELFALADLMTS